MLTNYDAKAVAEVMGIAFLPSSSARASPPAASADDAEQSLDNPIPPEREDFVIHLRDAQVLIVEVKNDNTFSRFNQSNDRHNPHPNFAGGILSLPSPMLIEKAVERGLPRQALRHVAERLAAGDKAKASWLEWRVVPKTTLERRETQLSPQESERTERIARLFVHARRALGTEAEACGFMTAPHPELDERTPIDAARTDLGARRIEQLLNALEYGLAL